jgi:RNA polymerase sigma-70 factor (ECF subfamily)
MMEKQTWLVRQFEENRTRLKKVAYRMLGSESEADDAVQEVWLRLNRSDSDEIDNLAGWLTTVVSRICLDMLRSRTARREESLEIENGPAVISDAGAGDPEREAILADSIGPALLVVLDMLTPPERVAFVLHDMFGMPYEQIAPIIDRTAAASRQLASRARRRVRGSVSGAENNGNRPDRRIVDAFLKAAREGDFQTLLEVLHPECVFRTDEFAQLIGAPKPITGGRNVAEFFNGGASDARRATIDGVAGAAWAPHGKLRAAFSFTFRDDRIVDIEIIADRKRLRELEIELLDG